MRFQTWPHFSISRLILSSNEINITGIRDFQCELNFQFLYKSKGSLVIASWYSKSIDSVVNTEVMEDHLLRFFSLR